MTKRKAEAQLTPHNCDKEAAPPTAAAASEPKMVWPPVYHVLEKLFETTAQAFESKDQKHLEKTSKETKPNKVGQTAYKELIAVFYREKNAWQKDHKSKKHTQLFGIFATFAYNAATLHLRYSQQISLDAHEIEIFYGILHLCAYKYYLELGEGLGCLPEVLGDLCFDAVKKAPLDVFSDEIFKQVHANVKLSIGWYFQVEALYGEDILAPLQSSIELCIIYFKFIAQCKNDFNKIKPAVLEIAKSLFQFFQKFYAQVKDCDDEDEKKDILADIQSIIFFFIQLFSPHPHLAAEPRINFEELKAILQPLTHDSFSLVFHNARKLDPTAALALQQKLTFNKNAATTNSAEATLFWSNLNGSYGSGNAYENQDRFKGFAALTTKAASEGLQGVVVGDSKNELNQNSVLMELRKIHSPKYIVYVQMMVQVATLTTCPLPLEVVDPWNIRTAETFIDQATFNAAIMGVYTAKLAAQHIVKATQPLSVVSISRPPGHHAGKDFSHGFCVFNNAAMAVNEILENNQALFWFDIDIHDGDGSYSIIQSMKPNMRNHLAFINIFGAHIWPHEAKAAEEKVQIDQETNGAVTQQAIKKNADGDYILTQLKNHATYHIKNRNIHPHVLVFSLGTDGHQHEEISGEHRWNLTSVDYANIIAGLQAIFPQAKTLIVWEGGYNSEVNIKTLKEVLKVLNKSNKKASVPRCKLFSLAGATAAAGSGAGSNDADPASAMAKNGK